MLQKFHKNRQALIGNHASYSFSQHRHFRRHKGFLFALVLGAGLFIQTLLLPMPAFSESEEVYPEGDQEYFKALLELEKDKEYKKFLMDSVSYAGGRKVEYIDYKGVRPTVDGEEGLPGGPGMDAGHVKQQTYEAMRNMDWFRKNNYQNFIRNV
ncbi:MAG TPA: hypothetical protein VLA60_11990, partial [Nitrospirales bacterium]|nr:hypothetical protein [Nitrospirales bacterium]